MSICKGKKQLCSKRKIAMILAIMLIITSPILIAQSGYTLTVRTDHSEYYPGETVKISGNLKENGEGIVGAGVCISITLDGSDVFGGCYTTGSQGAYSMTYTANHGVGNYHVTAHAEVQDVYAHTSFKVVSSTVVADANGPYYGVIGQPIEFSGDVSGGKSPHTWLWLFGDGVNTSDDRNPDYIYSKIGNYSVTLTARDKDGHQDEDYTTVTITDEFIADSNGPYKGPPNISISFKGAAYGGYPPYTWHWDFGDGNSSDEQNPEHSYGTLGVYIVNLSVIDQKSIHSYDITTANITENYPPNKPSQPSGPTNGKAGDEYTYLSSATDPNENQVYYYWDWGDGNTSGWLGLYDSGLTVNASYSWVEKGDYQIKVKSKDIYGAESNWSDPLPVSMPKNKVNPFFLRFLENHPHIFPLLRYILKICY